MRALNPSRLVAAVAVLALAAGTALAASPAPSPAPSAAASASGAPAPAGPTTRPFAPSAAPDASEPAEASEAPEAPEAPEAADAPATPPSAAEVADILAKLKTAGITTTAAAFQALAAKVGVGGAVRTLAFAQASGKTPAQIVAFFEGGQGWGQIDHELGLKIGPGIGWIMSGGHGHGQGKDGTP